MSDPKPTPRPRDRKARRKLSPGQVAYLEYKAVRDKAKAEREVKQRQDAYYLQTYHPEIAKAKRAKGVKNNAEASARRRQSFVVSFNDWPSVLSAGEMGYRIREWLRDRSDLNPKAGRRKWKWRGCETNFVKTEVSVRKKLTELEVFRYNFRLRVWFKCGSVEEAEATQRLAEEEAERRRLEREEEDRVEAEKREAYWETHRREQKEAQRKKAEADAEAERAKQEAKEAERVRRSKPFGAGWYDAIPDELRPTVVFLWRVQSLDEVPTGRVECYKTNPEWWHKIWQESRDKQAKTVEDCLRHFQATHDHEREMRQVAEAVLVAD